MTGFVWSAGSLLPLNVFFGCCTLAGVVNQCKLSWDLQFVSDNPPSQVLKKYKSENTIDVQAHSMLEI